MWKNRNYLYKYYPVFKNYNYQNHHTLKLYTILYIIYIFFYITYYLFLLISNKVFLQKSL
jgi:hypothetical protein